MFQQMLIEIESEDAENGGSQRPGTDGPGRRIGRDGIIWTNPLAVFFDYLYNWQ